MADYHAKFVAANNALNTIKGTVEFMEGINTEPSAEAYKILMKGLNEYLTSYDEAITTLNNIEERENGKSSV